MSAETVGDEKEGTMDENERETKAMDENERETKAIEAVESLTEQFAKTEGALEEAQAEAEKEKAERDADFAALNATVDAINANIDKRNGLLRTRIEMRSVYSRTCLEFELDRTQARFEACLAMNDKITNFELAMLELEKTILDQDDAYEKQRKAYEDKWERLQPIPDWLGYAVLGGMALWGFKTKKKTSP